jgi:hypothetical protein
MFGEVLTADIRPDRDLGDDVSVDPEMRTFER